MAPLERLRREGRAAAKKIYREKFFMKNKLFKTVPALVLAATLAVGTFAFTA